MRRTRYQFGAVQRKPRKLGPDVWVYRFTEAGVKRSITIGTVEQYPKRAQAVRAAESLRMNANADQPTAQAVTFGGLIDRYISEEMPARFSTADSYGAYIRAHIRPKWAAYQLLQIKPFAVEEWLKGLQLAPKSRGHIKTIMMSLFKCAMRWELVPLGTNPLSLVRVPGVSKRQTKAAVLTPDQVRRLIDAILGEPFKTMAWMSVCLGLEPSVLFGLKWGDIDFATNAMQIERGIVHNHVGPAKNEYRAASLPVDPVLIAMLAKWQQQSEWKTPEDWVFASPYFGGEFPYNPRHTARLHLWPAAKAAGIGDKIGWQSFRRTYSSLLRQMGADVKVQQSLMRHSDIKTTLGLYTDAYTEDMRVAQGMLTSRLTSKVQ